MDGTDFKTTDNTKWGAGTGAGTGGRMTDAQIDNNFWNHLTRLQALEGSPPEAISISSITVIGDKFQINLTDGSHQGPFTLPVAAFTDKGVWINDFAYHALDLVTVPHSGIYLAKFDHTSPASPAVFDPNATDPDSGDPLWQLVFGEDVYIYDVGFFYPGRPGQGITAGDAMMGHLFARTVTLPATLPGAKATLRVAPTADMSFPLRKNSGGTAIGSVNFAAGVATGTFTFASDVDFAVNDRLTVDPATGGMDSTARELMITIAGTRTDL